MYEDGIGREALCFDGERFQRRERQLAAELPCRLYLDGELLSSFTCSPWQLSDLALGELRIRGLIRSASELSELFADEEKMEIHARLRPRDGCGGEELSGEERMRGTEERILVPIRSVQKLSRIFNEASRKFHRTGGIHAAALADFERLLLFREDVGRRNAMEKLLGACLKEEPDLSGKLILFSGRIAAEILEGASLIGSPVLIAVSAPSSMAVELAEKRGMTLIGFARGEEFNIYTHPERIEGTMLPSGPN